MKSDSRARDGFDAKNGASRRRGKALARALATAWAALSVVGCGSARRGEPLRGPLMLADASAENGQRVYMRSCHKCHPGGEAGLGPALNNKPLPKFLVKFQIRHGLGVMPAFPKDQISDPELDDLATYIAMVRNRRG